MKKAFFALLPLMQALLALAAIALTSCCPDGGSAGESAFPSPPQGLKAIAVSSTSIDVTWTATSNAITYNIYWASVQGITTQNSTAVSGITATNYRFVGDTGADYYFAVTAVNDSGESLLSSEVTASPAPFIIAYAVGKGPGAGPEQEGVSVYTDSTKTQGIDGLTITFNGTAIAGQGGGSGVYTGFQPITPGGVITFDILCGVRHYIASGTQYTDYPTITVPSSGAVWDHSVSNTAAWTGGAPTSESCYFVLVLDSSHASSYGQPIAIPINVFTVDIPAAPIIGLTGPFGVFVAIATIGSSNALLGEGTPADGIPIPSALPHSSLFLMGMGGVSPIAIE